MNGPKRKTAGNPHLPALDSLVATSRQVVELKPTTGPSRAQDADARSQQAKRLRWRWRRFFADQRAGSGASPAALCGPCTKPVQQRSGWPPGICAPLAGRGRDEPALLLQGVARMQGSLREMIGRQCWRRRRWQNRLIPWRVLPNKLPSASQAQDRMASTIAMAVEALNQQAHSVADTAQHTRSLAEECRRYEHGVGWWAMLPAMGRLSDAVAARPASNAWTVLPAAWTICELSDQTNPEG